MTVVRPNSIAGINSITVQTGQALNIHDADGNLIRNIVSATGVGTFYALSVGTAGTVSNTGNAAFAGIVTANGGVVVGAAATIKTNGNATFSGIVTTAGARFEGDVLFAGDAANITWDKSVDDLIFNDNAKAAFGTGSDLQIYANGSTSIIDSTNQNLDIQGSAVINIKPGDASGIILWNGAQVELYYNAVKEFSTKSGGVKLWGHSEQVVNALGNSTGTVTIDFTTANIITATLTGTTTFANPTTESVGQSGSIILTQDGTGSRTASWGSQFKWVGGTAPTLTTTAAAVDRIDYLVVAADTIHCVASLDVK